MIKMFYIIMIASSTFVIVAVVVVVVVCLERDILETFLNKTYSMIN